MRNLIIYSTSVICGFSMMALEIMGGRYLYPAFGTSIDVWAAIISVFILSLSVGYWLGGKIADRSTNNKPLGYLIISAAICYFLLTIVGQPISDGMPDSLKSSRAGSLLPCFIIFFPPSLLLGCVSPILVKLIFVSGEHVGRTTGTLYAISNVGSVLGILVADYVLLAFFYINTNMIALGLALLALGTFHLCYPMRLHNKGSETDETASATTHTLDEQGAPA